MKLNRSPYSEVLGALSAAVLLPHQSHAQRPLTTALLSSVIRMSTADAGPLSIAFPEARGFPDPSARLDF